MQHLLGLLCSFPYPVKYGLRRRLEDKAPVEFIVPQLAHSSSDLHKLKNDIDCQNCYESGAPSISTIPLMRYLSQLKELTFILSSLQLFGLCNLTQLLCLV